MPTILVLSSISTSVDVSVLGLLTTIAESPQFSICPLENAILPASTCVAAAAVGAATSSDAILCYKTITSQNTSRSNNAH